MELINARLQLSAFLWLNGGTPYELDAKVMPDQTIHTVPAQFLAIENILLEAQTHPQLQQYHLKLESLKVDRYLKLQSLLPAVNVKYNQLTNSHNISKAMAGSLMNNNYRYGLSFSMPLRLSEGRGQYQKAGLKIEQTKLDQALKLVQIENKVKQYYNEWKQLQVQVKLQHQTVDMLQQLQRGEEQKLFNGESSLFMVNSREAKVLEARQKLIETTGKLQKVTSMVIWAAGQLVK